MERVAHQVVSPELVTIWLSSRKRQQDKYPEGQKKREKKINCFVYLTSRLWLLPQTADWMKGQKLCSIYGANATLLDSFYNTLNRKSILLFLTFNGLFRKRTYQIINCHIIVIYHKGEKKSMPANPTCVSGELTAYAYIPLTGFQVVNGANVV